jgi:transcriptional regulator with XRE-family HTH domain
VQSVRPPLAEAIREARLQANLTQNELAKKIGLKGRAVYRWERGPLGPSRLNQRLMLNVIGALHAAAAAKLGAVFAARGKRSRGAPAAPLPLPPTAAAPVVTRALLEHTVFSMADELDVPPRRVRNALARWLRQVGEASFSLDTVQRELDAWIGDSAAGFDRSTP